MALLTWKLWKGRAPVGEAYVHCKKVLGEKISPWAPLAGAWRTLKCCFDSHQ